MAQQPSLTSLPLAPGEERKLRMRKYTIIMTVRVACLIAAVFSQGWWIAVFAIGAIVLPYLAVVVANQRVRPRTAPHVTFQRELGSGQ